jgi:hypothetical protein
LISFIHLQKIVSFWKKKKERKKKKIQFRFWSGSEKGKTQLIFHLHGPKAHSIIGSQYLYPSEKHTGSLEAKILLADAQLKFLKSTQFNAFIKLMDGYSTFCSSLCLFHKKSQQAWLTESLVFHPPLFNTREESFVLISFLVPSALDPWH